MDFWARRKAAVDAETRAEEGARLVALQQEVEAEQDEKSDDALLAELGLPDPDQMTGADDFSQFMTDAVPQRLRTRALRRLWRTNPVLANLDGLVDYADDYTDAATVVENMQTSYQVGKGMLAHVQELARQAEEAGEETSTTTDSQAIAEAPVEETVEATPEAVEAASAQDSSEIPRIAEPPEHAAPRRMTFVFEESRSV